MVGRWTRLGLVLVLLVLGTAGVVDVLLPLLAPAARAGYETGHETGLALEQALLVVLAAAVLLAWLWCALTGGLLAVELTLDRSPRRPARRLGCPAPFRAVVLALLGVATVTALAGPAAADGLLLPAPHPRAAVDGLAVPDRQVGTPARTPGLAVHVVADGECLWSIAADQLSEEPAPARVSALWLGIYRLNRPAIGADPDLIRPGTVLHLPDVRPRKDQR